MTPTSTPIPFKDLHGKSPSLEDYEDFLLNLKKVEGFEWLKEVSCEVLRQSYRDLITAFSRFFKGVSDYPKFKIGITSLLQVLINLFLE